MDLRLTFVVAGVFLLAGCSDDSSGEQDTGDTDVSSLEAGESVYRQPIDDGNTFSCSTCHALSEPAGDGIRRVGHPIGDATRRPTYKNGRLTEMREAVNSCLDEWMNAEPWAENDPRWQDLHAWLDAQVADGEAEALSFEIVSPPADLGGGDAAQGRQLFNQSCSQCHGEDGTGTNRALAIGGRGLEADYVARRVRTSGASDSDIYDNLTGGVMPFWSAERLSDDELRHLIAFLARHDAPDPDAGMDAGPDADTAPSTDADTADTSEPDTGRECPQTHEKVGWIAELEEQFHDVGGTAEILDDCTVRITDFTYDATGIDVRIYGGVGGDYDNGYPMTDDLLRSQPYAGETLIAKVPEGETLDDLDGISVWCVDVGVDFGSGIFVAP